MDDYINRNNAIENIKYDVIRIAKLLPDSWEARNLIKGAKDSIDTLKCMPSIDAIEVVRCKDCKYKTRMGFCLKLADLECFWNTPADFFCKMGEVKE